MLAPAGNTLPSFQPGFHLDTTCTNIVELLNMRLWDHKHTCQSYALIQADITKAYDSMHLQALLDMLSDFDLPLSFLQLLANMLINLTGQL